MADTSGTMASHFRRGGFWPVNDLLFNAKYLQKYMRPGLQKRLDYNKMRNALHRYVPLSCFFRITHIVEVHLFMSTQPELQAIWYACDENGCLFVDRTQSIPQWRTRAQADAQTGSGAVSPPPNESPSPPLRLVAMQILVDPYSSF